MRRSAHARATLAAWALAASSCALSAEILEVPSEGARSAIFVFVPSDSSAAPEARALALTSDVDTITWPLDRDGALHVLRYGCALDALALTPGPLDLSSGTGRPLPSTGDVSVARIAGRTAEPWHLGSVAEAPLATVSIVDETAPDPCLDVDVVSFMVPASEEDQVESITALRGDEVLLATSRGRFFRASRARGLEALPQLPSTTPRHGGIVDDHGELWLFDGSGETVHGTIDGGFAPGPPMPVEPQCLRAVRSPPGMPFEVFVVGCAPVVLRFDGTAWTLVDETDAPVTTYRNLAWIGPSSVLAIGPDYPGVSSYSAGQKRVERLPIAGADAPRSIILSSSHGVLAGTEGGNTVRRDENGNWTPFGAANHVRSINLIFDVPGGIFFGGDAGFFVQYREGLGRCDVETAVPGEVEMGVPLDDGVAVVGRVFYDAISFVRLRVREAPSRCP